jgi:hypothetical protein
MDEQAVRQHAQAYCDALLAGDIGKASEEMSKELRSNLGPVVSMLPMPLTEASIESVQMTPSGFLAELRLVGEGTVRFETRWKDRDGRPTLVESSRVHEEPAPAADEAEGEPGDEG